jgi:hypothetical protein
MRVYLHSQQRRKQLIIAETLKGEPKREISSAGSEHLPYKQGVTGSNPVSPTKEKPFRKLRGFFYFREFSSVGLEHYLDKVGVAGSSPVTPTKEKPFRKLIGFFCVYGSVEVPEILLSVGALLVHS